MIATLTINPAIDKTILIEGLAVNEVNKATGVRIDAGGKGINASRIIKFLGERTVALGLVGGEQGEALINMLDNEGIERDFVRTYDNTRVNIKLVDTLNHTCTDINETGGVIRVEELEELKEKVQEYAHISDTLIFSGSAQNSVPKTVYRDIISNVKGYKAKIMLDTSGELLREGIKAVPWMIKPNLDEFSEILGFRPAGNDEIVIECKKLINVGIKYVCVSLGAEGLLLVSREAAVFAKPPKILARSSVGAGDAVAGSLAVSLSADKPLEEAVRCACAVSAACVTLSGTGVPEKKLLESIRKQVSIKTGWKQNG